MIKELTKEQTDRFQEFVKKWTDVTIKRFFSKVRKTNNCWVWTGSTKSYGYGRFSINKQKIYAHRFSYMIKFGHVPDHMVIHHKCNRKECVNPKHLEVVTKAENTRIHWNGYDHLTEESRQVID